MGFGVARRRGRFNVFISAIPCITIYWGIEWPHWSEEDIITDHGKFQAWVMQIFLGSIANWVLDQIGNLVSTALWTCARSFNVFLWARIVGGLSEGNVQLSIAIISDVTDEQNRSKGLVSIAHSLHVLIVAGMFDWTLWTCRHWLV